MTILRRALIGSGYEVANRPKNGSVETTRLKAIVVNGVFTSVLEKIGLMCPRAKDVQVARSFMKKQTNDEKDAIALAAVLKRGGWMLAAKLNLCSYKWAKYRLARESTERKQLMLNL